MASGNFRLTHSITTTPATSGSDFYVEAGRDFDVRAYARHHGLEVGEIRSDDVGVVNAAASDLAQGEWLLISHESLGKK